jgi:hypothetical protein
MQNHELIIIAINFLIIAFSYIWLYPKIAGSDIHKLSKYDFLSSIVSLMIVSTFFYNSGIMFEIFGIETNWFWFTLVAFLTIEIPFALWYFKKYDVWKSL